MNKVWLSTMGSGAKVMVLDTGLDPEVHVRVSEYRVFAGTDRRDYLRHGTAMARIIASRDPCNLGMAPHCTLAAAKVINGSSLEPVKKGLDWAIEWGADVVSMSFAYGSVDGSVAAKLKQLDERGTICLSAWNYHLCYPNRHEWVIAVGSIHKEAFKGIQTLASAHRNDEDGPGRDWSGSSVSTALMAGVAACAKAYDPGIDRLRFMKEVQVECDHSTGNRLSVKRKS